MHMHGGCTAVAGASSVTRDGSVCFCQHQVHQYSSIFRRMFLVPINNAEAALQECRDDAARLPAVQTA
jgi:hypothetical protein